MRHAVWTLLLTAVALAAPGVAGAQILSPPPSDEPSPTPTQCLPPFCVTATPDPTPRRTEAPEPTEEPTPAATPAPTPSPTRRPVAPVETETPLPTLSPTPTPIPTQPNRGLAIVGLFGSTAMIGSSVMLWRKFS